MSPAQVQALLHELCGVLGFCLPPAEQAWLKSEPPTDVATFADAVIRAEGLDPVAGISKHLHRDIRDRVMKHFKAAEDAAMSQSV